MIGASHPPTSEGASPLRILALVDGEHYPPVVAAALDRLSSQYPGSTVVGAALLGGTEKLSGDAPVLGVDTVSGATPDGALWAGLERWSPDVVFDLSDEPVIDNRARLRLAARALAAGAGYRGADFSFEPPPRPRLATKPTVAVIGTGKRTGKTAVSAHLARALRQRGTPPVVVAMGRGGPAAPELVDPDTFDLSVAGLVALAESGRHAASDHLEGAVMSGATTVGTRRCGGGLAGAPVDHTLPAGVALANERPEPLVIVEGSGQCLPPVHADATILVAPGHGDPDLVVGHLGAYRVLLADLIVITMAATSLAASGFRATFEGDVRRLVQGVPGSTPGVPRIVRVTLHPTPLAPISGRRIIYATTASPSVGGHLAAHLEHVHGAHVVGVTHNLANRPLLAGDLEGAGPADVLVVELKAAGIDLAARFAIDRGMDVVLCDNRVVTIGGDGPFEELGLDIADLAMSRFAAGAGAP